MSISASLGALTASLQDNGFAPTLEPLTGEIAAVQGGVGDLLSDLEALSGAFAGEGSFSAALAGSLEPLRGSILGEYVTAPSLEPLSGSFEGLVGTAGSVAPRLAALSASFEGTTPNAGSVGASFQALTGSFGAYGVSEGGIAAPLRALAGGFTGILGADGTLAGTTARLQAAFSGHIASSGSMSLVLRPPVGAFSGGPAISVAFRTWAMNTRRGAVTEYTSFPFNSFARYNGGYLAAGPDGLYTLAGANDDGEDISWNVVTGQMDDGDPRLKRLTEVLMGLRADGAVRVTVWSDDETSYAYTAAIHREGVLNQVRAKAGKGLRSRYFKVGLSGTGPSLELDSLQLNVPKTNRRIG